jgi:lactoylglutathione lyase
MTYKNSGSEDHCALAHLGLVVVDADRSAQFYTRVLGLTIGASHVTDNLKIINLHTGALTIELLEYMPAPPVKRGAGFFDHIAFMVADLDAAVERLREQGVPFETEAPRQALGHRIIFCAGPDGERIELMGR